MRGAIKRYHQRRVSGSLSGHQPLWGDRTSALSSPLVRNQSRNQSSSREIAPRPCRAPWYAISHAIKAHQGRSHLGLVEPLGTQSVTQSKLIKGDRTSALSSPLTPEESMPTSGPMAPHLHAVRGNHQWLSSLTIISGNRWQSVAISGSMPQSAARWRLTWRAPLDWMQSEVIRGHQRSSAARWRLTWRAPLDWTCELARGSRSREMPSCASACRAR